MDLIVSLIAGAIAGALALFAADRRFPSEPIEWVGALLVGIVGGWVGGFLFTVLGLEDVNVIGSVVVAFVGALIVLLVIQRVSPSERR